jgi:ribonuclease D
MEQQGINTIAMDFEGEINLHIYGEHLCLIQVFDSIPFI